MRTLPGFAMEELMQLMSNAKANRVKCEVDAKAYSLWLSQLVPANLVLVVGAAVLSLLAGASILVDQQIISNSQAGIMAVLSSIFTVIHNRLNCDQHQAECRRLQALYQGLSVDYGNLETETDARELKKKLDALNNELAQIIKGTSAHPSAGSMDKARRIVQARNIASGF